MADTIRELIIQDIVTQLETMQDADTWEADTAYSTGDIVKPTTANGYAYKCTVGGTSDSSEPTWPDPSGSDAWGDTVADNTVTWQVWDYNTGDYGTVYRGRTYFDYEEMPCITVLPGVETADKQYGEQFCTMPVTVHAVQVVSVGDGEDRANQSSERGEIILGDLINKLIRGRDNIDRINNIRYTGGGIEDYPDVEEQTISVQVSLEVDYCTNLGDPYTQTSI